MYEFNCTFFLLFVAKINTDNKKEITELEKKNESVARHFAAAKVANPTPKPVKVKLEIYEYRFLYCFSTLI